jgi:hypothetical protein
VALIYRDAGTSGTQFDVLSGDLRIAHIGKDVLSGLANNAVTWRWDFAIGYGPRGFDAHGRAVTFDEAKAAVELNWQVWLTAARLKAT